jgi:ankyrin repeat protein
MAPPITYHPSRQSEPPTAHDHHHHSNTKSHHFAISQNQTLNHRYPVLLVADKAIFAERSIQTMTNPNKVPSGSTKKKGSNNKPKKTQEPITQKPAILPPIESPADYSDLLETARSLSPEESREELLECARYGETDAVRAILEVHSTTNNELVNTTDSGGSTALHKAAANGHINTVSLLLFKGAMHIQNENGATPLHWAAGAGKNAVCQLLLDHFDAISKTSSEIKPLDVLLKNSFGRSALTEAFTSSDTETVGVLLNHDSAEEEKLIGGMKKEKVDGDEVKEDGRKKKEEIIHEFDFRRGFDEDGGERKSVLIRELVRTQLNYTVFMLRG